MKSSLIVLTIVTMLWSFTIDDSLVQQARYINDQLVRCEFDNARHFADSLLLADSTEPLYYYLKIAATGLESLDRDRVVREKEFKDTYEEGMKRITTAPSYEQNSYLMMLKGFMETSLSSFYLISGKYFSAVSVGKDGLKSVEKARELDKNNYDVDYYRGFFSYAQGELKQRVPILFWLENSSKEGITTLQKCSDSALFMNRAADMVLVDVLVREGELDRGNTMLQSMLKEYPGSRFLLWTQMRFHDAQGNDSTTAETYMELSRSYCQVGYYHNGLYTAEQAMKRLSTSSEKQQKFANELKNLIHKESVRKEDLNNYSSIMKYCKE